MLNMNRINVPTTLISLLMIVVLSSLTLLPTAAYAQDDLPDIITVEAGENSGNDGHFVTFDNGVTTHVPTTLGRALEGNSAPPALGEVQSYEDTRICVPVAGCGFGYVHFTDSEGREYKGT
jgi:hypothetical protein